MRAYCLVLTDYTTNSDAVNHAVVKMLYRLAVRLKMSPLLYQISVFRTLNDILHEPLTTRYKVTYITMYQILASFLSRSSWWLTHKNLIKKYGRSGQSGDVIRCGCISPPTRPRDEGDVFWCSLRCGCISLPTHPRCSMHAVWNFWVANSYPLFQLLLTESSCYLRFPWSSIEAFYKVDENHLIIRLAHTYKINNVILTGRYSQI